MFTPPIDKYSTYDHCDYFYQWLINTKHIPVNAANLIVLAIASKCCVMTKGVIAFDENYFYLTDEEKKFQEKIQGEMNKY